VPVPPGAKAAADLVIMDDIRAEDIQPALRLVNAGGILAGLNWQQKPAHVQRAVAKHFNLLDVGVGPCGVWFVKV
jgi:hypothetical protein